MGITSWKDPSSYGLSLTLGGANLSLIELATVYATVANYGKTPTLTSLLQVTDNTGAILYKNPCTDGVSCVQPQALDPRIAFQLTDILRDNVARVAEFGEGGPLEFDIPVAAKTGTTRNSRDNWTMGYTPTRIVGVWVGNADNSPMKGTSGVTGAGPIFHDVMLAASKGAALPFARPSNIVDATVCTLSGKLPTPLCPTTRTEHFVIGTVPTEHDDIYREFLIDSRNGLLANETCEQKFVVKSVRAAFPGELLKWARDNGWPIPPAMLSPL
jgi:penicillin-binding protein 1C